MTKETFAARLRELREAAGLTQIELAQKSGLPSTKIRDMEQQTSALKWEEVEKVADALGVSLDCFREMPPGEPERPGPGRPAKKISSNPLGFSLIGYVAAGSGSLEEFEPGATLSLGDLYQESLGCVAYQVTGDSMIESHIQSGDYIIVRVSPDAKPGDVVVVWIPDMGAVVKKLDKRGVLRSRDGGDWKHKLTGEDRILGVLVGVIRRC